MDTCIIIYEQIAKKTFDPEDYGWPASGVGKIESEIIFSLLKRRIPSWTKTIFNYYRYRDDIKTEGLILQKILSSDDNLDILKYIFEIIIVSYVSAAKFMLLTSETETIKFLMKYVRGGKSPEIKRTLLEILIKKIEKSSPDIPIIIGEPEYPLFYEYKDLSSVLYNLNEKHLETLMSNEHFTILHQKTLDIIIKKSEGVKLDWLLKMKKKIFPDNLIEEKPKKNSYNRVMLWRTQLETNTTDESLELIDNISVFEFIMVITTLIHEEQLDKLASNNRYGKYFNYIKNNNIYMLSQFLLSVMNEKLLLAFEKGIQRIKITSEDLSYLLKLIVEASYNDLNSAMVKIIYSKILNIGTNIMVKKNLFQSFEYCIIRGLVQWTLLFLKIAFQPFSYETFDLVPALLVCNSNYISSMVMKDKRFLPSVNKNKIHSCDQYRNFMPLSVVLSNVKL
jgi:hypothetical protein